jgi:hypothetical protein
MQEIRDMETEATRIAALSPQDRARHEIHLMLHRLDLGLEPEGYGVVAEVLLERRRQVSAEGWTAEHDDEHGRGEMAMAAACYASFAALGSVDAAESVRAAFLVDELWPWDFQWWKPKDRRRDLVRAAALIVAEIERLDRAGGRDAAP